jgi:3-dehydroquinate synthase
MSEATRIRVRSESPYDVIVGPGVRREVARQLPAGVRRVCVLHAEALLDTARGIERELAAAGVQVSLLEVPNGEQAKTAEVASACWTALGQLGMTRSDAVVSVGGGATTDLAGFVAATFLRGIAVLHVPTTLLGMVDAAVGGKTGINTTEGKNLVGAFHEPAAVLCDLDNLRTLPRPVLVSGLAEVIKCGFVSDEEILGIVESDPCGAADPTTAANRELIERAVRVKADVVSRDLRELTSTGTAVGREALNYGHTFGHAVERVERYAFPHGAAVSIGMVYVAELARLAGRLDDAITRRHRDILASVGLPTAYASGRWTQLFEAMRMDKKSRADRLRFVILEAVGRPAILEAPDSELLTSAYASICARD